MNIYYWKAKTNFGDLLSPLLLKKFLGIDSEWSPPAKADVVMVGSVLEHLPETFDGVIAGTGMLHERTRVEFPYAKILAVRGPLTARRIRNIGNCAIGDMGLLCDELVQLEDKRYHLGIVPHWTDDKLEHNPMFLKYNPRIIKPTDDPLEVIREIGRCRKVVSSSLHGIILADAFGIPRRVEIAPKMLSHPQQEGGVFKWKDYHASLDMKLEVGVTKEANRNKITDLQHELFDVLEELEALHNRNV